ncbi:MAG: PilZ domain-containing protein [Proteobacteria bacterium]|nr:PilZ domain-containing protein [Pseudomonadota bacterium]
MSPLPAIISPSAAPARLAGPDLDPVGRRLALRLALQMPLSEHLGERAQSALTVNLCGTGMMVRRLTLPLSPRRLTRPLPRDLIGLEFELPGTNEKIWATGEIRHDHVSPDFHLSGVRFRTIARAHQQLIVDYVTEERLRRLRMLLGRVQRVRQERAVALSAARTAAAPLLAAPRRLLGRWIAPD